MGLQQSKAKGLDRLMAQGEQHAAVSEEMDLQRLRFDSLREAQPTRAVSSFNLFQTPKALADELVLASGISNTSRVLEPSAGLGRLYQAIRYRCDCEVVLVENSPECCAELYAQTAADENTAILQRDFLECTSEELGEFDVVLMNPPFKMGTDIKHIEKAAALLKPGGRLVSLCYAGVRQSKRFQYDSDWTWRLLPSGSFRSEGTSADVAVVTYVKDVE